MPVRTWQGHLLLSMLSLSGCTLCSSVIAMANADGHCCCLHLSQVQCADQTDFAICPCLGKPCYACFGDCLLLAMQAHQDCSVTQAMSQTFKKVGVPQLAMCFAQQHQRVLLFFLLALSHHMHVCIMVSCQQLMFPAARRSPENGPAYC